MEKALTRKLDRNEHLDLARKLALMCEIFNRRLSDDAMAFWMAELAPHYGPELTESLRQACLETWMPSVGWVIENVGKLKRRARLEREARVAQAEKLRAKREAEAREALWQSLGNADRDALNRQYDELIGDLGMRLGLQPGWMTAEERKNPDRGIIYVKIDGGQQ